MSESCFEFATQIDRPAAAVYEWHTRPGAFARLQPPWETIELLGPHPGVVAGARVRVRSRVGPWWSTWEVEHRDVIPGREFSDVMIAGPFAHWEHRHSFEPIDDRRCRLIDRITYRLPGGAVGRLAGAAFVRSKLRRLFTYRHALTKADLEQMPTGGRPLTVLLSGASGLVGVALQPLLATQGHAVKVLVRREPRAAHEIFWDPSRGELEVARLGGIDAVVHLSGENVAAGRWTARRKEAILRSRVDSTRTLVRALTASAERPAVLISASAVGIYGERGAESLAEGSSPGSGFLAEVCAAWEAELAPVTAAGIRTVALRTGVVLTPAGGALAKMLPAFRCGVGGRLGSGRQWMSWISLDDLVAIIVHLLTAVECRGPVNAVAPGAVTNAEFTAALGRVLGRPTVLPVPAAVLRGLFGEMADAALLASTRAVPQVLQSHGYRFRHADLEPALRHVLGETLS
jgi:uncharacterized protein (TIGR01777 family)